MMKKIIIIIISILSFTKLIQAQTGFACFNTNTVNVTLNPIAITSGNFNGDANKDIVVSYSNTANYISVFNGNGNGTFSATPTTYNVSTPFGIKAIITSNFDDDLYQDIAVVSVPSSTINFISVFYGNASGLNAVVNYTSSVPDGKNDLHAVDVNGDAKPDLIIANNSASKFTIMTYTGTRNFNAGVDYNLAFVPLKIKSGLINNDAFPDLVIAGTNSVAVCLGSATGTYAAAVNYSVIAGGPVTDIEVLDLNGDNRAELVILTPTNRHIYSNNGLGVLTTLNTPILGNTFNGIVSADFDGDTKSDIASCDLAGSFQVQVMLSDNSGNLPNPLIYAHPTISPPIDIIANDFDNDTKPDIITLNNNNTYSVLMNKPRPVLAIIPTSTTICLGSIVNINGSGAASYTWSTGSTSTLIAPTPTASTIYSVTGTQYGCNSALAQSTVTVFPIPFITVNSGSVCAGNNFTMIAGGASTYTYSSGSATVAPLFNSTYSVTGTNTFGCISSSAAISTVTVNPLPVLNIVSTPSAICAGNSSTLSANGATNYSWTGPGILSGALTASPTINAAGNYSLVGTSSFGCVNSQTIGITINPTPTVTVNSGSVCAGNNFNMFAAGASTYTYSSGSATVSPLFNSTYSVTGTSAFGCVSTNTAISSVTVNLTPTIIIAASSPTACAASISTFTASGANTYTWSTGSNSLTIAVTPTVTTSYTLNGTNANGCVGTNTVNLLVSNSTNVGGNVTTGASIPVAGLVTLFRYEPVLTKFDSITSIAISGTGAYTFTNAINSNTYMVRAIPNASTLQATYGNSSISWMNGTKYIHGCASTGTMNINVIAFTTITAGLGSLSGVIEKGPGYGQRLSNGQKPLGTPIKGVIVKGGRNPGGNIVAQTTTDAAGNYTLAGLPNDNFFILVDIAGLDTNGTYHRVISSANPSFGNLNFTVDSVKINPILGTVGINEFKLNENTISIFPNPASNILNINFSLITTSDISIEVFDLLGKSVKKIIDVNNQATNNYQASASMEDLNAGVYFVNVKINNKKHVLKLIVE